MQLGYLGYIRLNKHNRIFRTNPGSEPIEGAPLAAGTAGAGTLFRIRLFLPEVSGVRVERERRGPRARRSNTSRRVASARAERAMALVMTYRK